MKKYQDVLWNLLVVTMIIYFMTFSVKLAFGSDSIEPCASEDNFVKIFKPKKSNVCYEVYKSIDRAFDKDGKCVVIEEYFKAFPFHCVLLEETNESY